MNQNRFKFRAWCKEYHPEMLYDVQQFTEIVDGYQGKYLGFSQMLESEDYILMQCTGLKDKNGKLIYEGDIIQTRGGFKTYYEDNENLVVEFGNGGFQPFANSWDQSVAVQYTPVEIIGNIYENPELPKRGYK